MAPPNSSRHTASDLDTIPAVRFRLEVDNESTLPMLLEGRTVAVLGRPLENHTAESSAPQRRLRIHEQLQRARRLRASLEHAANLAESLPSDAPASFPEAISILQSSLPDINQLVRLTESLRGNYTLHDNREYDEWTEWATRQNQVEEEQTKREHRILRQQLREFSREKNPHLELNDELEAIHDSLIEKPKQVDEGVDYTDVLEEEESEDEEIEPRHYRHRRAKIAEVNVRGATRDFGSRRNALSFNQTLAAEKAEYPSPTNNQHSKKLPSRKKTQKTHQHTVTMQSTATRARSAAKKRPPPVVSDSRHNTSNTSESDHRKKAKVEKAEEPEEDRKPAAKKMPPKEKVTSPTAASLPAAAAPPALSPPSTKTRAPAPAPSPPKSTSSSKNRKKSSLKTRPPKKCHHCKDQTSQYRNCNYWKLSGTKCGKAFCVECLSSKYSLGDDVQSATKPDGVSLAEIIMCAALDAEWHCPSCLGTCQCSTCVKQRKKEEEREKSRLEADKLRKPSRRSAAARSYYNFM